MMKLTDWIKRMAFHVAAPEKLKYNLIVGALALVHGLLLILFGVLRILPLALLNVCSITVYVSCLVLIRKRGMIIYVFCATYLEIIIHSFVVTVCIGWQFGFSQYIIALVPFGYYMCYAFLDRKHRYVIATWMGLAACAVFIGCRVLSAQLGPVCELEVSTATEVGIYCFNAVCNFSFLFMVTAIFVVEIQYTADRLQSQNAVLDKLASIDPLTGLYNRRSMQVFLEQAREAEEKEPFCLAMCDIDDFKKVNDTYGHDFGDSVLKKISAIMEQRVGRHGYVCRWGGEEILILINGEPEQACQIAEKIRCDIGSYGFRVRNQSLYCTVTVTIGVARHKTGDTVEATIVHADNNLYHGKRHGKNRVVSLEVQKLENV